MSDRIRWLKLLLFIASLLPLLWLVYAAFTGTLGVNPVETLNRTLGDWTLRFLLLTLAITPLRRLSGWRWLIKLRRMFGLFAFFYASLHLTSYIVVDQFFDWPAIWGDIVKRPYITVGMSAYLLLIPLAITSSHAMMRRMGKNWQRLHRLIYPIAIAGVVHYYMLVKADTREPLIYAVILALLLISRLLPKHRLHANKIDLTRMESH